MGKIIIMEKVSLIILESN